MQALWDVHCCPARYAACSLRVAGEAFLELQQRQGHVDRDVAHIGTQLKAQRAHAAHLVMQAQCSWRADGPLAAGAAAAVDVQPLAQVLRDDVHTTLMRGHVAACARAALGARAARLVLRASALVHVCPCPESCMGPRARDAFARSVQVVLGVDRMPRTSGRLLRDLMESAGWPGALQEMLLAPMPAGTAQAAALQAAMPAKERRLLQRLAGGAPRHPATPGVDLLPALAALQRLAVRRMCSKRRGRQQRPHGSVMVLLAALQQTRRMWRM